MKKHYFILMAALSLSTNITFSQDYKVGFMALGIASVVDSVYVENIVQGTSLTLNGTDTLHLLASLTNQNHVLNTDEDVKIYPNPAADKQKIEFYNPEREEVNIEVFDLLGRNVISRNLILDEGVHVFELEGLKSGNYTVRITSKNIMCSRSIIFSSSKPQNPSLSYIERSENILKKKQNTLVEMQYNDGEVLFFKAYSGNHKRVATYYILADVILQLEFVACSDADFNHYGVLKLGTQYWMAENLKTTKYNNGIPITHETDDATWAALSAGAYSYYQNNTANLELYGALYNWFAVNTGNLCPIGWRVPSESDWDEMNVFLQNYGFNYNGGIDSDNDPQTHNFTAKAISSRTHWVVSTEIGSPGNTDYPNYRNRSGFTLLPAGVRNGYVGSYSNVGIFAYVWASESHNTTNAKAFYIINDNVAFIKPNGYIKTAGLSVRCIKN